MGRDIKVNERQLTSAQSKRLCEKFLSTASELRVFPVPGKVLALAAP
jgi:hypothetical protein